MYDVVFDDVVFDDVEFDDVVFDDVSLATVNIRIFLNLNISRAKDWRALHSMMCRSQVCRV